MLRKIFGRLSEGDQKRSCKHSGAEITARTLRLHSIPSALIILGKWAGMLAASFCRNRRMRARSDGANKPIAE
jgi:hypothetical protein